MYKSDRRYTPGDARSKLSVEDVHAIRQAYAAGIAVAEIHSRYAATGVSYSGLLQVLAGRSWNWIESDPLWRTKMRQSREAILTQTTQQKYHTALARYEADKREHERLLALWENWATALHPRGSRKWPTALLQIAHICRDTPNGLTLQAMANSCGVSRERIRQVLQIPYANQ